MFVPKNNMFLTITHMTARENMSNNHQNIMLDLIATFNFFYIY